MNSVPTAQVILGIDSGDGTGENAFLEFENCRKSPTAGKVAEWYEANKHIIIEKQRLKKLKKKEENNNNITII